MSQTFEHLLITYIGHRCTHVFIVNHNCAHSSDNLDAGSSVRDNPDPSAHYMDPMSVLSALQKAPAGTVYRCQWVNTNALIRRQGMNILYTCN